MFVGYFAVDSRKDRSGTCSPLAPPKPWRGVVSPWLRKGKGPNAKGDVRVSMCVEVTQVGRLWQRGHDKKVHRPLLSVSIASTSPPTTRGLAEALVGASNFNPLAFGRENGIHLEAEVNYR